MFFTKQLKIGENINKKTMISKNIGEGGAIDSLAPLLRGT